MAVPQRGVIATSADVAKLAGVSRSTVSQILNGRGELFSPETRDRVTQAVATLGYLPSTAGRTLARGSSDIVVAIIPNTTFGSNLQAIFDVLTVELAERGLTLVLRLSTHGTAALDRIVVGMKPRAVLSFTPFSEDDLALLDHRGVQPIDPVLAGQVDSNREIGVIQAKHLVERGYRRLAFAHLVDSRGDPFGQTREVGFRETCGELGAQFVASVGVSLDRASAHAAVGQLGERGVAVACYNDDVATALLFAARMQGWQVPAELALIGMDHTPLSQLLEYPLTTLDYDLADIAYQSVSAILGMLGHEYDGEIPVSTGFRLIQGETT